MTSTPKIRGDKLVLATISVLRTLIMELDKAGAVDVSTVIAAIDDTAKGHRETGDPNRLADAIEGITSHLGDSLCSFPEHRDKGRCWGGVCATRRHSRVLHAELGASGRARSGKIAICL